MENNNLSANEPNKNQDKQTPDDLVKKHLSDPTHKITEEEMENLETKPEADPDFEKKEKDKLEELKNEVGKHPLNPYDILDNE
jgi:hypothetical protein